MTVKRPKSKAKPTAILLLHCPDKRGIVAAVTHFLDDNAGNIISLDEHVDREAGHFFMRVEWQLEGFTIPKDKISEYFQTIVAQKYDLDFSLHFSAAVPRVALFVSRYSHCFLDIMSRYESGACRSRYPSSSAIMTNLPTSGSAMTSPFTIFP